MVLIPAVILIFMLCTTFWCHKSIMCCKNLALCRITSVTTEKNRTPLQIWVEGFYRLAPTNMNGLLDLTDSGVYGIDDDGPTPELQTANDVQVPEIDIYLSVDQENYLASTFDPCANDGNLKQILSFKFETRSRSWLNTRNNCSFS